jgi:hypothetical protein
MRYDMYCWAVALSVSSILTAVMLLVTFQVTPSHTTTRPKSPVICPDEVTWGARDWPHDYSTDVACYDI